MSGVQRTVCSCCLGNAANRSEVMLCIKNFCVLSVFVAVGILGLPFPGVGAHFFDAVFRFPAELFFCFGSIGVAGGDVAGAAVSDYVRDFNAGCFFEVLYDIEGRCSLCRCPGCRC